MYGRFLTSLRTDGKLFALFSKDVLGEAELMMYEVVDTEQDIDTGLPRSRSMPALKLEPIPVYKTAHAPCEYEDIELYMQELHCENECPLAATLAARARCTGEECHLPPDQHVELLTVQTVPVPASPGSVWSEPDPRVGLVEYQRSPRGTMEPSVARIKVEQLPVSPPEVPRKIELVYPKADISWPDLSNDEERGLLADDTSEDTRLLMDESGDAVMTSPPAQSDPSWRGSHLDEIHLGAVPRVRDRVPGQGPSIFSREHRAEYPRHSFPPQRPTMTEIARVELALEESERRTSKKKGRRF